MTDHDSTSRRLQAQLWPGFLLVAVGAGALWWQRGADESTFGRAVLMAVPVLLAAGVLLLLRAVKLKEQQAEAQRPIATTATARKTPARKGSASQRTTAGTQDKRPAPRKRG